MALQTGLATSKFLLIVGASVGGSILIQNGSLSDFLAGTYKVLLKHLNHRPEHSSQSSVDPNLLEQLSRLRQELSNLASDGSSSITFVSGSSRTNGSLLTVAVPALLIGATGYGYIRWKGKSLSDFMYVTRRTMSDAVSNVSKKLEHVSNALTATKRQLTLKLENLSGSLDQNMELQTELKNELSLVREDVDKYGLEIETVQRLVQSLGVKIDTIESKQDIANMGVVHLCNFVERMQITQLAESVQGVQRPDLPSIGSGGLKDLQSISDALESADASPDITTPIGSSDIVASSPRPDLGTPSYTKGTGRCLQRSSLLFSRQVSQGHPYTGLEFLF